MIEITNLSFYYKRSRPIFENVSFRMESGIYGLLGENGVGKTTLLHIISGLRFPKRGSGQVFGYDSYKRNPEMLQQLFFLPEEFLPSSHSVLQLADSNKTFYPNYSQEQLMAYLEEFQVEGDRKLSELSTGQKKKAMIAYGFSLNTPVTLLDEPTNGLDIPSKTQFRKILSNVAEDGKCIIISTHQVRDLAALIDPIIILDKNQVLLNNSVDEIIRKVSFVQSEVKPADALYAEQSLQGYHSVIPNPDGRESTLNVEMLFNAVVNNKALFREMFEIK